MFSVATVAGIPIEYCLFGAMLAGISLLHRHSLVIALAGLASLVGVEALVTRFPTGTGFAAFAAQCRIEAVTLANIVLLLTGFELLANQFEKSNLADHLPRRLPDGWSGGLLLLALVFLLSAILDNIAAAMIGGVMARHVYRQRVGVGFVAAIVAAANAGGSGSVIGDTTTTIMWLHGVAPGNVLRAYIGAVAAFLLFAPIASWQQHRHQPIVAHNEPGHPIVWRRIVVAGTILLAAVVANIVASRSGNDHLPWLGIALWAAIGATRLIAAPDWTVVRPAANGALFLGTLVFAASLMPLAALPSPSPASAFGLGGVSALFDNIPLTVLALAQGGHDWGILAYAVGFGGSMLWFGSSAGVALTNDFPEGRSVATWLREAWFVPLAYAVGFAALMLIAGWRPELVGS